MRTRPSVGPRASRSAGRGARPVGTVGRAGRTLVIAVVVLAVLVGASAPIVRAASPWSPGSAHRAFVPVHVAATSPLQITVTASPTAGAIPLNVSFLVTPSGGVPPYSASWSFGDGSGESGAIAPSHVFSVAGNYTASVSVTDAVTDVVVRSIPIAALTSWEGDHQWSDLSPALSAAPPARSDAQMAYDPVLQAVVLFGGSAASGTALGDTWEFVNNGWIDLTPTLSQSPSARFGAGFAFDPLAGELVLFGGTDGPSYLNDTWTFTASGWSHAASAVAPSPRAFVQMAFDATDGYTLLFGGAHGSAASGWTVLGDTWAFSGGAWSNLSGKLTTAPTPTAAGAALFDASDNAVLLFGGSAVAPSSPPGTCFPLGRTWEFAGGTWTAVATSAAPAPRLFPGATFDGRDNVVLLFGGAESRGGTCAESGDTWSFLGSTWANVTGPARLAPPPRDQASLAYDGAEGVVVLFGGESAGVPTGDTWLYPTSLNLSSTTTTTTGTSGIGSSGGSAGGGNGSGSGGTSPAEPFTIGYSITSSSGEGSLTVVFVATATGGVAPFQFDWAFGDASPNATGAAVSHGYVSPGDYRPTLTATDASGFSVARALGVIHVAFAAGPGPANGPGALPPLNLAEGALALGAVAVVATALWLARSEKQRKQEE
jgi:PKD repeat protein